MSKTALITSVAYLLAEALAAGVSIAQIMHDARMYAGDRVSPAQWDIIMDELERAKENWENAGAQGNQG